VAGDFVERRQHPRVRIRRDGVEIVLPTTTTVQLLDISETGVLLGSSQRLEPGRRAQLRTRLGPEPVTLTVEIRRVVNGGREGFGTFKVGAEFVNVDEDARRRIERFLKVD
jgi:c-di-GMP-binding flagellar brake protein YcgR